jgi:hypothetical protein
MKIDLPSLAGREHGAALGLRAAIAGELAMAAPANLRAETCCLTLLAGAGTRWVKSLKAAKEKLAGGQLDEYGRLVAEFPLDAPRGLFPVRNFIAAEPARIPLAAYALDAFAGLGRHLIVIHGWEAEIRSRIVEPLGIDSGSVDFFTQREGPFGKVLGHGDAARQSMEQWRRSTYVVVNFGGDANSPLTAMTSLLALVELERLGEKVGLLLPVANIPNPAYPVILDEAGLPRAFGHDKLSGAAGGSVSSGTAGLAYTNVGIRVYRTEALLASIEEITRSWWSADAGYSIPGNDPEAHEFALDNVDALLASRGAARILAIANPEELTPAKSFDEIGRFEDAARKVRAEWTSFRSAFDSQ